MLQYEKPHSDYRPPGDISVPIPPRTPQWRLAIWPHGSSLFQSNVLMAKTYVATRSYRCIIIIFQWAVWWTSTHLHLFSALMYYLTQMYIRALCLLSPFLGSCTAYGVELNWDLPGLVYDKIWRSLNNAQYVSKVDSVLIWQLQGSIPSSGYCSHARMGFLQVLRFPFAS